MAKSLVFVSVIVDAPLSKVWPIIRDFNDLPSWHPGQVSSEIEDGKPADQIGCVRKLITKSGAIIRETLISLDDMKHSVTYNMIEGPFNFKDYLATINCKEVTMQPDKTYIERYAFFIPNSKEDEETLIKRVRDGIFISAFRALQEKLSFSKKPFILIKNQDSYSFIKQIDNLNNQVAQLYNCFIGLLQFNIPSLNQNSSQTKIKA